MRRGLAGLTLTLLTFSLASAPAASANSGGDTPTYAREAGFNQRFFYVAAGDGEGQIQYICRAFPGRTGSDDLTSSVWQVQRFSYDSDDRITDIEYAGDDDSFTFACSDRASLDYD